MRHLKWNNGSSISLTLKTLRCFVIASSALVLSYISTNLDISLSGERGVLKYWRVFKDWAFSGRESDIPNDVVFINVANDKQLVDVNDEFGIPVGNAPITDRNKLLQILEMLDSCGTYKYIMLDVFFEEGYQTSEDSSLFSQIANMRDIVIPKHRDGLIALGGPDNKAAFSDYSTSVIENDFSKYKIAYKNGSSLPLKAYYDLTGHKVRKRFLWYSDEGALSRMVVFPKMYVRIDSPYRSDGEKAWLNLGVDILDYRDDIDLGLVARDKVVVIGAMEGDDIHSTYAGSVPGCVINYNVFKSLMKGQHNIPVGLIAIYFLIFFAMAYLIIFGSHGKTKMLGWMLARQFALYSVLLTVLCIVVFEIWGQAHDIFITSSFFSLIDIVNRKLKKEQ